jgi:hypothetical protein
MYYVICIIIESSDYFCHATGYYQQFLQSQLLSTSNMIYFSKNSIINENLERYQYGKIIMKYIHLKSVFYEIKDFISLCSDACRHPI